MRILVAILFLCLPSLVLSQQLRGSENRKATKLYEEAREHQKWGRLEQAEASYLEALEHDPAFLDAMFDLSEVYLRMNNIPAAKEWSLRIVESDVSYAPNLLITLGMMEQSETNYQKAQAYFERYLKYAPAGTPNHTMALRQAASCEFAAWATEHPVPFDPVNLGENINTSEDEYFPALTADEHLLLFTREIDALENPFSPDGRDENFFFAERQADGSWGKAFDPGPPINTIFREGAPALSPDGQYLIFTVCDLYGQYGEGKQGYGSCDLFVAVRRNQSWTKPVNMGMTINSNAWESQPSFSSDGKTIYFIRGKYDRNHVRHSDIYVSELIDGKWSKAVALPSNINSEEDEESVFIHPDNQTLYFSSRGHVGMGDMDIYMSRRQPDGSWGDPVNLGYPINTAGHENSFHVSASGKYAIISSDREGGFGGMDLYAFELPESIRPNPVTYLKGRITDASNGKALEANFRLINLSSGDTIVQAFAEKGSGNYLVVLPDGHEYGLIADHEGYLFHSENFRIDLKENETSYTKNIALQPIAAGSSIVLKNVFFDTDKFDLKRESGTELNKLVAFLKSNPELKVEISGHTDNQGSAAANQLLSENRAKSVYAYLIRAGIAAERLSYVGHGQTQPIASNDTEAGRAENRRTEFRIVQ